MVIFFNGFFTKHDDIEVMSSNDAYLSKVLDWLKKRQLITLEHFVRGVKK